MVLNDFFQVSLAILKYEILSGFSLLIFGVIDIEHFDNIATVSEFIEHLEFSTDIVSRLSGSFNCDCLFVKLIPSLKYIAYRSNIKLVKTHIKYFEK